MASIVYPEFFTSPHNAARQAPKNAICLLGCPYLPCFGFISMRILSWFLRLVVFLLLFGLALNNLETVTLHLLFGTEWRTPMIVLLLVVFALGAVLGALALLPSWMRHRKQVRLARNSEPPPKPSAATAAAPADFPQHPIDRPIDGV